MQLQLTKFSFFLVITEIKESYLRDLRKFKIQVTFYNLGTCFKK